MQRRPSSFILAVGTELTSGQTLNRNAAWISRQLQGLGIETREHRTVSDDRGVILQALHDGAESTDLVFVTGGLGPTSDDFTREVIAEFVQAPLEYDPHSWDAIVERLSRRGVPVSESNKQQCFFPKGARILRNSEGTANGFHARTPRVEVFALPGPPREIEAIWKAEIEADLARRFPDPDPVDLRLWQTLGKSEAAIGEITEGALQGSGLQTGYRVHLPYVEVKVWVPRSRAESSRLSLEALDRALEPWTVAKDNEDVAELFLRALERLPGEVVVHDALTPGLIADRAFALLRQPSFRGLGSRLTWITGSSSASATIKIEPAPAAGARLLVQGREHALAAVFPSVDLRERNLRALSEKFFIEARRAIRAP